MRTSVDAIAADGTIKNGFDYNLQVWVENGVVLDCGHPDYMRATGACCNKNLFAGLKVSEIEGREVRI